MDEDKSDSGLTWGIEVESLVLEIFDIEEIDEIGEDELVEILFQREELQSLLGQFVEQLQQYPEMIKKHGWKDDPFPKTVRGELKCLLGDVTDGNWHCVPKGGFGAHRKLTRWISNDGEHITIRKVRDESDNIKKS